MLPSFALVLLFLIRQLPALNKTDTNDIIAVVQVTRHGQRLCISSYPKDPFNDPHLNSTSLTNVGKKQMYELGKLTRARYEDFLPKNYNSKDFNALTTDTDRTHMSAQCTIAGIYKPKDANTWNQDINWTPVPVKVAKGHILYVSNSNCKIKLAEQIYVLNEVEEYVLMNEKYAELFNKLSKHSGLNITNARGMWELYDILTSKRELGYEIPEWAKAAYDQGIFLQFYEMFLASGTYTDLSKQITVGGWLFEISQYFSSMFENPNSSHKFRLYSGHDITIFSLLNTLENSHNYRIPPFGASLYFELKNKSNVPIVNIWYYKNDGNEFEQIKVNGCDFDCNLDDFNRLLQPWMVDETTWQKLCLQTFSPTFGDLNTIFSYPGIQNEFKYFNTLLVNYTIKST